MSFLDRYYSEKELAELLQSKFGYGGLRMLRAWRQRRMGPPFAKFRKLIVYPKDRNRKLAARSGAASC